MTSKGAIIVNGTSMVTKLPSLKKNSVVVFQASRLTKEKLRVSISVDDKEVTYDWSTPAIDTDCLYFACVFEHTGWQLSVGWFLELSRVQRKWRYFEEYLGYFRIFLSFIPREVLLGIAFSDDEFLL